MAHHSPEEMLKHIKVYLFVFFALAVLTVVTVWAAYLEVSTGVHVLIAMSIAAVKGGLVVAYFMHLISEKKLIYTLCIMTAFFFIVLLLLTLFANDTMGPLVPNFW